MALAPGTRLGAYEILSLIGSGGMEEMYRAKDTKLNRDVAIKVLLPAVANDPDRLMRFSREAQVLASLNHPNIAHIHGVDESAGTTALVMELVDGQTLADRIAKGPVPLDEALPIAKQIAEALEAAHERGIIHRDLKPANIKVREDGTVKVLDFGLAKAMDPEGASSANAMNSPTITAATVHGVILGTAAYMSPEQARGKTVDKRADVWAFGCVLYELLCGHPAFPGATVSEIVATVLTAEPRWEALPEATPEAVVRVLRRCLRKDRDRRQRDIGDARLDLEDAASAESTNFAARYPPRVRLRWIVVGALALVAATFGAKRWTDRGEPSPPPVLRLDLDTPPSNDPESFALSPTGDAVALIASTEGVPRLAIRRLDQRAVRIVDGTEGATQPFWSPDGRSLGFFADKKLKRVDVAGGAPLVVADAPSPRGGAWDEDDTIVFAPATPGGLMKVSARGGHVSEATTIDPSGALSHRWPTLLPHRQGLLFLGTLGSIQARGIYATALDGGKPARLTDAESGAAFAPPGRLLLVRGDALIAMPFNPATRQTTGDPVTLAEGVSHQVQGAFSVAGNGILAYRTGSLDQRQLHWIDRHGNGNVVGVPDGAALSSPELSPDGRRAIIQRFVRGSVGLWVVDLARGVATRLTSEAALEAHAIWAPDGRRIAFTSFRNGRLGLYMRGVDGNGTERAITSTGSSPMACDWSPDGRYILYGAQGPSGSNDLWAQPVEDGAAIPVVQGPADEMAGQFSPDGRFITYVSDASGRNEVYVKPFPSVGQPTQLSASGGSQPRWSRDGRDVFFVSADGRLTAAAISRAHGDTQIGAPRTLFRIHLAAGINIVPGRQQYAVAPDGRFLVNESVGDPALRPINVALNFWRDSGRE